MAFGDALALFFVALAVATATASASTRPRSVMAKPMRSPSMRRQLTALPGFDVGKLAMGEDIAHNGVAIEWQKWDPLQSWAEADVNDNTVYVVYLPRYGQSLVNYTIESARVPDSTQNPNEANCTVATNPPVGTMLTASNVSSSFTVAYSCTNQGKVRNLVLMPNAQIPNVQILNANPKSQMHKCTNAQMLCQLHACMPAFGIGVDVGVGVGCSFVFGNANPICESV